jgi:tryptophan 2,3-dioxygenase
MPSPGKFLASLSAFDLLAYEEKAGRLGRARLRADSALVSQIVSLSAAATKLHDDWIVSNDRSLNATVEAARHFLIAQEYILTHDRPRYEPYATIRLLRHVLEVDRHRPLSATQRKIWAIFQWILLRQIDFEMKALAGTLNPAREQFKFVVSRARIKKLAATQALIPHRFGIVALPDIVEDVGDLCEIGGDRSGAAIVDHLLVFPQTTCHDEVAFISLIQMAECLFWGTLIFVQRALAAIHVGRLVEAVRLVGAATEFAAPLIKVFHCVKTMPPDHFLGFREATGDASAVQCQSWQMLDAHVYGVLPDKAPVLEGIPEVRHVLAFSKPHFVPLVQVAGQLGGSETETRLTEAIIGLDNRLRAWRKFHEKQLAGRTNPGYLPPQALGTGLTSGYGYLAAQQPPRAARIAAERTHWQRLCQSGDIARAGTPGRSH